MIPNIIRKIINRFFPAQSLMNRQPFSRETIAERYLKGHGIEIGALHKPLKVPHAAKVKYLDRLSNEALRQHYPELDGVPLVSVDILDDGETLATIPDHSQDFVIANHLIEHCRDPIKAVMNMLRVLKKNGILYLSIPDKRYTFDRDRPITTMDHIIKDFDEGPDWSRKPAFEEYVKYVDKVSDEDEAKKKVTHYMAIDYSIHYHAWTEIEMLELIMFLKRKLGIPFMVELVFKNDIEVIMILRVYGNHE